MSSPVLHHWVPKVYLRQFLIEGGRNGSFVWCRDLTHQYDSRPKRLGINHGIFKSPDYYTDQRYSDPHVFEKKLLGGLIEPMYHQIMQEVNAERLPQLARENLLNWLFVSKLRSPFMRENARRFIWQYYHMSHKMQGKVLGAQEEAAFEQYIARVSKEAVLDAMTNSDDAAKRMQEQFAVLNAKHWRILRSPAERSFMGNDNPGFSPNMDDRFAQQRPFHHVMEINAHSIILYVLSARYCLEITPFLKDTPLTDEWCAMNMNIQFVDASPGLVDYINSGTYYTRHKLIISNSLDLLERSEYQTV